MEFNKKTFDKLIKQVESTSKPQEFVFYAWSEEIKEIINKQLPNVKVILLPQSYMKNKEDRNKVYIIPVENLKPIKICFDEAKLNMR